MMTAAKPTLTKSLHTITAVANVAQHLLQQRLMSNRDIKAVTAQALAILGYDIETFSKSDPTVERCLVAVAKLCAGVK